MMTDTPGEIPGCPWRGEQDPAKWRVNSEREPTGIGHQFARVHIRSTSRSLSARPIHRRGLGSRDLADAPHPRSWTRWATCRRTLPPTSMAKRFRRLSVILPVGVMSHSDGRQLRRDRELGQN